MGTKNVKIKNIYIDHHKYLGKRENSPKIYDLSPRNMILSPFNRTKNVPAIDAIIAIAPSARGYIIPLFMFKPKIIAAITYH